MVVPADPHDRAVEVAPRQLARAATQSSGLYDALQSVVPRPVRLPDMIAAVAPQPPCHVAQQEPRRLPLKVTLFDASGGGVSQTILCGQSTKAASPHARLAGV